MADGIKHRGLGLPPQTAEPGATTVGRRLEDASHRMNGSRISHRHRLGALQRVPLFEAMSVAERQVVEDASRLVQYQRRQRVFMPGDPSDHLLILTSGAIKLSVVSPEAREIILGFLHPTDVFGELAALDDAPRDHIAEAYEDSTAYLIPRETLRRLMHSSPALAYQVTKLMGDRLRTYRRRVEELLYKSAHARVAHTLHDLAGHHGVRDAQGVVIPLRLSQRDIANLVGLTRETVNFILKDLRRRNLIETQGRSIRVREPDVLLAER